MKINSRFQDFYDWELSCSHDDTLIYDRQYRSKTIKNEDIRFSDIPKIDILVGNICVSLSVKNDWIYNHSKVRSKFVSFCDDNGIYLERQTVGFNTYEPEFTIKEDLRFHDGSTNSNKENNRVSKTEKTGELLISQPMKVLFSAFCATDPVFSCKEINDLLRIQCQNTDQIRAKYDIKAPVALIFGNTVHENFSFMKSGIDIVGILNSNRQKNNEFNRNQQQIAAEIDSYLQETYNEELTVTSNNDRIVSNGFDLKVSFRNRGEQYE